MPHMLGLFCNIFKNINSVKDKMPHTVTHNINRNTFAHFLDLFLFSAQARMMFWKDQWVSRWLILLTCGRLRWANMANIANIANIANKANIANIANIANVANMKRETVNHFSGCCRQLKTQLKAFWKFCSEEKLQEGESGRFSSNSSVFCIFPHNKVSTNMGDAFSGHMIDDDDE